MPSTTSQPRNQRIAWKAGKLTCSAARLQFHTPNHPSAASSADRGPSEGERTRPYVQRETRPHNGAEQSSEYVADEYAWFGSSGIFFMSSSRRGARSLPNQCLCLFATILYLIHYPVRYPSSEPVLLPVSIKCCTVHLYVVPRR